MQKRDCLRKRSKIRSGFLFLLFVCSCFKTWQITGKEIHILLLLCKASHLQGIPLQAMINKLMATLLHKARRITLNELFTIMKWIMTPGLASVQNVQFLFVWIFLRLVSMMCKKSRITFWALRRSTTVQYVCVLTYKALCCWCKIFGFCFRRNAGYAPQQQQQGGYYQQGPMVMGPPQQQGYYGQQQNQQQGFVDGWYLH